MSERYLKIQNLSYKYYQGLTEVFFLHHINLSLKKGELIGLIGPSGCGKTTLLRLIAGFETPISGTISIENQIVASKEFQIPPERRKVGMVFQDYALFPHLNSWENVCFGLKVKKDSERASWLLNLLGLFDLRFRYPHELSGGQKQRLALARALAPGNSFVLLDEPFSSLDIDVRYRLRSELKGVLESCSASGILVTHDPEEALAICDRVAVMKDGKIHQCATPSELVNAPKTTFVGRFALHRNILPLEIKNNEVISPLGPLYTLEKLDMLGNPELLVDENSLEICLTSEGEIIGVVEGREFLGSNWRIRIRVGNILIRVIHSIDNAPQSGEKCEIKFKKGGSGIVFPGSKRIYF